MRKINSPAELCKEAAFVKGNRAVSSKNLKQKMESIKVCGQLVSIIIVNDEDAFNYIAEIRKSVEELNKVQNAA